MRKRKSSITTIIFDIGGVTIDWDDTIVYRYVAKTTGKSVRAVEDACGRHMRLFDTARITESEYWRRVARDIGYGAKLDGRWLDHYGSHARKNPAVVNAIRRLGKDYNVATITNVIKPHYNYNKKKGLYKLFDSAFISCLLKMRKPDKNIYFYALRKLHAKPQQCVFIDNTMENITTAKKLGMKTILFRNAGQMKRELRKHGLRA